MKAGEAPAVDLVRDLEIAEDRGLLEQVGEKQFKVTDHGREAVGASWGRVTMSFTVKTLRLEDGKEPSLKIQNHPDECPVCRKAGRGIYLKGIQRDNKTAELVYRCPREACRHLYIAYFRPSGSAGWKPKHREPMSVKTRSFHEIIQELSSDFCEIYKQASAAEQHELDEVAGVGYRKALEFLVKDYLIDEYPEEEETIREKFLGTCIKDHIEDDALRNCATMASWLGNDETHYERRWVDKDIEDLKHLIELTEQAILTTRMRQQYEAEMLGGDEDGDNG